MGSIFYVTCTLFITHLKKFLNICFSFKKVNRIVIIAEEQSLPSVTNKLCAKMSGLKIAVLAGCDAV